MPSATLAEGTVWRRLRAHIFEVAVAVTLGIVGASYLVDARQGIASPVGRVVHPFDYVWSVGYLVGLALILFAVIRRRTPARVAGLSLLGASLTMQGIAALTGDLQARDFTYLVLAAACLLRACLAAKVAARGVGG